MLKHTSKWNGFNLAENALIIAFFVLSSPCEHKNGFVRTFVLQQLPLYEAVASANEWPKAAEENEQTDELQQLLVLNNSSSKVVGAQQQTNFHVDANLNGTTNVKTNLFTPTPTSTKLLFAIVGDGDDEQQQVQKKKKFIVTTREVEKDNILNLSTKENTQKHQKREEKSSESKQEHNGGNNDEDVVDSLHVNPSFNHFHPLGFLNGVRHQNMLRKIRKLAVKGFKINIFLRMLLKFNFLIF